MGNVISEQLAMFLRSILLGACLALVYDLLRLLRRLGGRFWGGALDASYCVAASVSLFLFVMAGDGELRLFFLLGAVGGAVLFFSLLSPLLLPLWELWLEIFLAPVRMIGAILKKIGRSSKKVFSFCRKWFTIMTTRHRRSKKGPPPEGDGEMETTHRTKESPKKKRPQKKVRKRASSKLTLLILALLLIGIAVQLRSIHSQIQDAQAQEAAYKERLAQLQVENAQLAEDIANSDDPALIEEIARNELGMVSEGEKVFRFQ